MVNLTVVSYRRSYKKEDFTDLNLFPLNSVFKVKKVGKLNSIVPIGAGVDDDSFGHGKFPFDAFNANDKFSSNGVLQACFRKLNDQEGNRKARESMSSDQRAAVLCKFLKGVRMSDAAAGIVDKVDARGAKIKNAGTKRPEPDQSAEEKEEVESNEKRAKKAKKDKSDAKGNGNSEKKPKAAARKKKSSSTSVAGIVTEGTAESITSQQRGSSMSEQFVNEAMRQALKQQHPEMSEAEIKKFVACFKNSYNELAQSKVKESGEEEDEEKPNRRGRKRHSCVIDSSSSDDDSEDSEEDNFINDGSSSEDDSGDGSDSVSGMDLLDVDDVNAINEHLKSFELTLKTKENGCAEPTFLYAETIVQGIMGGKHNHKENRQLHDNLMTKIEENYNDKNKNDENIMTIINSAKIKGFSAKVVIYEIDQNENNEWGWTGESPIVIGDKEGKNVVSIVRRIKKGKTIGYYTLA